MDSKYCRYGGGDGDGNSGLGPNGDGYKGHASDNDSARPAAHSRKKAVKGRKRQYIGLDEFFSRISVSKKEDDFNEEFNPLLKDKVLQVLFSKLSTAGLKNCRLVNKKWNQLAITPLSKLLKPVKFNEPHDLHKGNGKLGHLIKDVVNYRLFVNFKFDIKSIMGPQMENLDRFFKYFHPQSVEFAGHDKGSIDLFAQKFAIKYGISSSKETQDQNQHLQDNILMILKKAAGSIGELSLHFDTTCEFKPLLTVEDKLSSIIFPNLKSISIRMSHSYQFDFQGQILQRCAGPNSPHLKALTLDSMHHIKEGRPFMDLFTKTGLASKLDYLEVSNIHYKLLNVLAQLGQDRHLKLKEIKSSISHSEININWIKSTVNFMNRQSDYLKALEFRYLNSMGHLKVKLEPFPFPRMKNVTKLYINDLKMWAENFTPLNLASTFPKLIEFSTCDVKNLLTVCTNGGSIKKLQLKDKKGFKFDVPINFIHLDEIFCNLEFLELPSYLLPKSGYPNECFSFWIRLTSVVVHFELRDFLCLNFLLLKELKELHIEINAANNLAPHNYLSYIANTTIDYETEPYLYDSDFVLYMKFMTYIFDIPHVIHPASVRVKGFRIANNFKNDFKTIFPNCCYTETQGHLI